MKYLILTTISVLIGFYQNCSPVKFSSPNAPNGVNGGDDEVPLENLTCNSGDYVQGTSAFRAVDILFVIDTSGSLDAERGYSADGISNFINSLDPDIDYNVAVMLGHGSTSSYSGKLFTKTNSLHVLKKSELSLATIASTLRSRITGTGLPSDNNADGGEEGIYSLQKGITNQNLLADSRSKGFFRDNAALAVIFVADENDICADYSLYPGVVRVPDGGPSEANSFPRDCAPAGQPVVDHTSLVQALRSLKGNLPLSINGVVYDDVATVPPGGENEYGYGYIDAINLVEGITVDLAGSDNDIRVGLGRIGELVNRIINLKTEFFIDLAKDVAEMRVWVDGDLLTASDYEWDEVQNILHLHEYGSANSTISYEYCWWE